MIRDGEKRTESLTVKTTKEIKKEIDLIARSKRWTLSQTIEEILKEYFKKS